MRFGGLFMNCREQEIRTLSFSNEGLDRGVVEESMYPWDKTVAAWDAQGLKTGFLDKVHFATLPTDNLYAYNAPYAPWENYYNTMMTEPVFAHESKFAFDPVKLAMIDGKDAIKAEMNRLEPDVYVESTVSFSAPVTVMDRRFPASSKRYALVTASAAPLSASCVRRRCAS